MLTGCNCGTAVTGTFGERHGKSRAQRTILWWIAHTTERMPAASKTNALFSLLFYTLVKEQVRCENAACDTGGICDQAARYGVAGLADLD